MKDQKFELKQVLGAGACDIKYDPSGRMLFACCNTTPAIAVNAENPEDVIGTFSSDKAGFSTVSVHPTRGEICFGGDDCAVVRFSTAPKPKFDHQGYITTPQFPVRSIAYSVTGAYIFVGTDDHAVRMINTADCSVVQRFETDDSSPGVRFLTVDPTNSFFLSIFTDGYAYAWAFDGKRVARIKASSKLYPNDHMAMRACFSPDGKYLYMPGTRDVVVWKVGSWDAPEAVLKGHKMEVAVCAISLDGKFLASAAIDGSIMIWDLTKQESFDKAKSSAPVSALVFAPDGSTLAMVTEVGQIGLWKQAVPSHMLGAKQSAVVNADKSFELKTNKNAVQKELEKEKEKMKERQEQKAKAQQARNSKYLEDAADESDADDVDVDELGDFEPEKKGSSVVDGLVLDDDDFDVDLSEKPDEKEKTGRKLADDSDSEEVQSEASDAVMSDAEDAHARKHRQDPTGKIAAFLSTPQVSSFMPSSTPGFRDSMMLLCWNMHGALVSTNETTQFGVEIDFSCSLAATDGPLKKNIKFKEHYGLVLGSLDAYGAIFASRTSNSLPSVVMYKPFESWAPQSDVMLVYKDTMEDVHAVACSKKWFAVATSSYLRLYSVSGLPLTVLSLPGRVVSMVAFDGLCALIYLQGLNVVRVMLLDVDDRRSVCDRSLPAALQPPAQIVWCGFSDAGLLTFIDNEHGVHMLLPEWDYSFVSAKVTVPVVKETLGAKHSAKAGNPLKNMFPLAIAGSNVIYVKGRDFRLTPRPFTAEAKIAFPGCEPQESSYLVQSAVTVSHVRQDQIAEATAAAVERDAALIQLVQAACKGERALRALDAFSRLRFRKSMEGCVKVAMLYKMSNLAQRMNFVLANKASDVNEDLAEDWISRQFADADTRLATAKSDMAGILDGRIREAEAMIAARVGEAGGLAPAAPKIESILQLGKIKPVVPVAAKKGKKKGKGSSKSNAETVKVQLDAESEDDADDNADDLRGMIDDSEDVGGPVVPMNPDALEERLQQIRQRKQAQKRELEMHDRHEEDAAVEHQTAVVDEEQERFEDVEEEVVSKPKKRSKKNEKVEKIVRKETERKMASTGFRKVQVGEMVVDDEADVMSTIKEAKESAKPKKAEVVVKEEKKPESGLSKLSKQSVLSFGGK